MARSADAVVVEVEAQLSTTATRSAEGQFDQSMDRIVASAGKAEKAVHASGEKMAGGFMNAQMRTRQLGLQIGQLGSSLGSGMNPMMVFAQQASDFAYTLDGTRGVAGRLASFFSGPWGAALLAAGTVVAMVGMKMFESGEEAEDLTDKLRKQERQSVAGDKAQEAFGRTLEGVTAAIRENRKALDELNEAGRTQAEIAMKNAQLALARLRAHQAEAQALLNAAEAYNERNRSSLATADPRFQSQFLVSERRLEALRARLAPLDAKIAQSERDVREAEGMVVTERAMEGAVERIKRNYDGPDGLIQKERQRYNAGKLTLEQLNAQVAKLRQARDLEIERAQAAERKPRATNPNARETQDIRFGNPAPGSTQTSGYGMRTDPITGQRRNHPALDFAGGPGRIEAPAGGVVIRTGVVGGLGHVVWINHGNGVISQLNHLAAGSQTVRPGDTVVQGQQVGTMGSTGRSTGRHLDWRVKTGASATGQGGQYADPRGVFRVSGEHAAASADQIAERQEREAQRQRDLELDQLTRFNAEMIDLQQALIQATRGRVTSTQEALEIAEANIVAATDEANLSYQSAADQGRITQEQANLLAAKRKEVADAQINEVRRNEQRRLIAMERDLNQDAHALRVDGFRREVDQAETADERRAASLRLLDAETELERLKLLEIQATAQIGSIEHERATLALARLNSEQARRAGDINRDPANMSPGDRYTASLQQTAAQIDEAMETAAVDGLKRLEDGLLGVVMGTESVADAFKSMADVIVQQLIRIAIQQMIIKPIAEALFGAGAMGTVGAGGGGSGGGIIAAVTNLFRASGGPVHSGQSYIVGEQGPELFRPGESGTVIPNHALATIGGGGQGSSFIRIEVAGSEMFDVRVAQVSGQVSAEVVRQATPRIAELATVRTVAATSRRKM